MAGQPGREEAQGAAARTRLGPSWAACTDKPALHVLPRSGWLNDPNGLVWQEEEAGPNRAAAGRLHAFYQHVVSGPAWAWGGLCWGHASSSDGVVWRHEPVALTPSRDGGHDAAGAWSGCCVPRPPGAPRDVPSHTLLFTGVSLRAGPHARAPHWPPIPPESDLGLEQHECQLAAVCVDGGEGGLRAWQKRAAPIIPHAPPPGARLSGFRDPFVFQGWDGDAGRPWRLAIGSGHKGGRGCLLAYASGDADPSAAAWVAEDGVLCDGGGVVVRPPEVEAGDGGAAAAPPVPSAAAAAAAAASPEDAVDLGGMWECPGLGRLVLPGTAGGPLRAFTLVCVSPYPHRSGSARPANPPVYWLCEDGGLGDTGGTAPPTTLDLAAAAVGPVRLDLGDALYAPTLAAGRPPAAVVGGEGEGATLLMMGWLQELRPPAEGGGGGGEAAAPATPARDYSGCLSLPRVLRLERCGEEGGDDAPPRLVQAPLPGLARLRVAPARPHPPWPAGTVLAPGAPPRPIPGAAGDSVDLELVLERPNSCGNGCATGLWLRPALAAVGDAPGLAAPTAVALRADWAAGRLEVAHFTGLNPSGCPDPTSLARRIGGACAGVAAGRVALRIVADHSAVEVFAGTGEALTTRVYGCGLAPAGCPVPRWSLFAMGNDGGAGAPVPAAAGWAMGVGWEEEEDGEATGV